MLGTSYTNVIGTDTQDKTKVTLQPAVLEVLYRFLPVERFKIISMIGKDRVAGLAAHLEPFLMAIRKKWMAEVSVAASHNTVTIEKKIKEKARAKGNTR